ncbi:MAG: hypothetical protein JNG84_07830 [Archangium sp.]|nr:hypothetical protein [Archangium sp.]
MPTDSYSPLTKPGDFTENEVPTRQTKRPFGFEEDPVTDPGIAFDEAAPYGRGSAGKPLDQHGAEWDVVTSEGHGFNDSDGPAQMKLVGDPPLYKDDWGPWRERDLDTFFQRHVEIEKARAQHTDALEAVLARHRLRNLNQWDRVCFTYYRHHGPTDARFVRLTQRFDPL